MHWSKVFNQFSKLDDSEKFKLFRAIKESLFGDADPEPSTLVTNIREARFNKGITCVYCGCDKVRRNGHYRDRQRYICTSCKRTFNDLSHSPLAGTWYLERMIQYFDLLVKGETLKTCADSLMISMSTSFFWRHKILSALCANDFDYLSGIVEADETMFLESYKGTKNIEFRKPRKRGGKAKKRGLSDEQVAVLVGIDRKDNIVSKVAGRGKTTANEVAVVLKDKIDSKAEFCSDAATNFKSFAKNENLKHRVINASKGQRVLKGIYHIQHANSYHKRLKSWMERFGGVATKYLNNYLYWFYILEKCKSVEHYKKYKELLLNSNLIPIRVLCKNFRPCLN